jgi:hypothetical protein
MSDGSIGGGGTPPEPDVSFEVIESNRWLIFARDEDGYGIWPVDSADDEPLRRFPDTDEGAEVGYEVFGALSKTRKGSPLLSVLLFSAVAVGVVWVVANAYIAVQSVGFADGPSDGGEALMQWAYAISQTGFPAFLVLAGSFIMVWMTRRDRAVSRDR